MAAQDSRALANPFIAGVDLLRQIVVGYDIVGKKGTAADNLRTDHCHETDAPTAVGPANAATIAARSAAIRGMTPALAMSMAMSSALAKPSASVPPWLFTTTPLRPRKIPPFEARGSSLRRKILIAPLANNAPIL